MKDTMGIIYTGSTETSLERLTENRDVAALPIAGRYRVIDFLVSSMVNSGIRNVGVIMQKNYHSMMDHLGSGKEWDLHGKTAGLVILPPFLTRENVGVYKGFLDALRSNMSYLRRSREKYVVICNNNMVFTSRYDEMLEQHIHTGADLTMMYTRDPGVRRSGAGRYLSLNDEGRVIDIEIAPTNPRNECASMEAFIIARELLYDLADKAVARAQYHFTRDILLDAVRTQSLKIMGFEFKHRVWNIDSVSAYFACSSELLTPTTRAELFRPDCPVWTKVRDEMPTRYADNAQVTNSLIADGCVIEGCVENSTLFRGVRVERDACVKNCVIMQDGHICRGAQIINCVLDKQATVQPGVQLIGPRMPPIVIAKNDTI